MCGGGSGGHVIPALTIISSLPNDVEVIFIGSENGIERKLTEGKVSAYFPIRTGKLRRYLSVENLKDFFRVFAGIFDSFSIIKKYPSESVIISFGGFVSVPVVIAGRLLGRKVFVHEQTTRVGLANKIASFFCHKVFVSFESSKQFFPSTKVVFSGYPIRKEIYSGEKDVFIKGVDLNKVERPILFITGGGNGAKLLNDKIKESIDILKQKYFTVHQVGANFEKEYLALEDKNYKVFGFLKDEMIPLMKKSNVIISRAGAGTVAELLALKKRSIFIPLKIAQKNEQYHNAMEAHEILGSKVLIEDEFRNLSIVDEIDSFLVSHQESPKENFMIDGREKIVDQILECF